MQSSGAEQKLRSDWTSEEGTRCHQEFATDPARFLDCIHTQNHQKIPSSHVGLSLLKELHRNLEN